MEKLVEEPVEGGAPECKVLAYFTDGNVHPHLEISERRIRYYHTPGDIGFREFQLHGVYFAARTKLVQRCLRRIHSTKGSLDSYSRMYVKVAITQFCSTEPMTRTNKKCRHQYQP